jgi:hypothetical protein
VTLTGRCHRSIDAPVGITTDLTRDIAMHAISTDDSAISESVRNHPIENQGQSGSEGAFPESKHGPEASVYIRAYPLLICVRILSMTKRWRLAQGKNFNTDKKGMSTDTHRCARVVESFLVPTQHHGVWRYVLGQTLRRDNRLTFRPAHDDDPSGRRNAEITCTVMISSLRRTAVVTSPF